MLEFDMEEIAELINDLNIVTKIKCVLYDKDFRILHDYKEQMCPFCATVRSDPAALKQCLACDLKGFEASRESKSVCRYRCHMGLTETVTPILCEGEIVGYIMMGQNLMSGDREAVRRRIADLDSRERQEALTAELARMRSIDSRELTAMCDLVDMCASYLRMKKLIKFSQTPIAVSLQDYIEDHLSDELDIRTLCREFKVSRSSLYLIASRELGVGITEYIRRVRMERAMELLAESAAPVSHVAEQVGFSDTNYFTKVFKKYAGRTPTAWRSAKGCK
ncbi:MAG: PocR ligand-binding domain-containing protein [Clostridia bacterium]|nr:PocR ligand-binding domain-containing protein [Clostridia bacterium]